MMKESAKQVFDSMLPPGFLRREETLEELNTSEATLERMTRDQRIRTQLVPRTGRKPERVYSELDVTRLKREKETRAALRPPSAANGNGNEAGRGGELVSVKTAGGFTYANLQELVRGWSAQREEVGVREKVWLTWDQAAELSGIPIAYVRVAANEGHIVARKFGRSWRVLRSSLERWEG